MIANKVIRSISYNQDEIIQNILQLHVPLHKIDCDPTYSLGKFYKNIEPPKYKFDIAPQTTDTVYADCRQLPLESSSLNCIMFDPPFLASSGKSLLSKGDGNNIIAGRFGIYPNEKALHQFYLDSLKEFYRILRNNGILIVKCQDKVSSGKQYLSHCFIISEATKIGYYPKDLFILLAKNRIVAEWQAANQKNARKFHSYFVVLEKSKRKIDYLPAQALEGNAGVREI